MKCALAPTETLLATSALSRCKPACSCWPRLGIRLRCFVAIYTNTQPRTPAVRLRLTLGSYRSHEILGTQLTAKRSR